MVFFFFDNVPDEMKRNVCERLQEELEFEGDQNKIEENGLSKKFGM